MLTEAGDNGFFLLVKRARGFQKEEEPEGLMAQGSGGQATPLGPTSFPNSGSREPESALLGHTLLPGILFL